MSSGFGLPRPRRSIGHWRRASLTGCCQKKQREVTVTTTTPSAGMDVGDIRSQFVADLKAGRVPVVAGCPDQAGWWLRSIRLEAGGLVLIVDDGDGSLLRVPFSVDDQELTYAHPQPISNLPIAASAADAMRVLASWPARFKTITTHPKEPSMKISPTLTVPTQKLRALFDLPAWADEAMIRAAMKCAPAPDVIRACSKRTPTVTTLAASRTPRASLPAPVDQASYDQFMAQHFATDRRRLQGDVSVHHVHG